MPRQLGSDLFVWHGDIDIWVDSAWRQAALMSNIELCERFGLLPPALNGVDDSLNHPFDRAGNGHMAYLAPPWRVRRRAARAHPDCVGAALSTHADRRQRRTGRGLPG